MKIILLSIENAMRLSAVEVAPKGAGLVIIAGANAAGKSSVLNSIEGVLGGKDSLPEKPVRRGEQKAVIRAELGEFKPVKRTDLIVKRTITATGGNSLILKNKDNETQESPQAVLDKLYSNLTFDPIAFKSMKPDKRSETLCELLGLDFKKEDAEIDRLFADRTGINREVKALEARVKAVQEHLSVPAEEVSAAAVLEEQRVASEKNRENERVRTAKAQALAKCSAITGKMVNLGNRADKMTLEIESMKKSLAVLEAELAEEKEAYEIEKPVLEDLTVKADSLKDIDLAPFADKIAQVEETNAKVRANKQKASIRKDLAAKVKEADALTKSMDALESEKRKRKLAAKFPVDGLSLSDTNAVLFNGIPFEQCSTAEQLKVSVAMGISMNPELRVLLIRQGNDLDADNLKLLDEMAIANDVQIWIERVSTEGDVSVIIEDGHVKKSTDELDAKMNMREGDPEADHHERVATGELPLQPEDKPLL